MMFYSKSGKGRKKRFSIGWCNAPFSDLFECIIVEAETPYPNCIMGIPCIICPGIQFFDVDYFQLDEKRPELDS